MHVLQGHPWRGAWPWALPVVAACGLVAAGLGALDYHACLFLTPAVCVAAVGQTLLAQVLPLWQLALRWAVLLLGPCAILAVAAPWQPSCAPAHGLLFYVLGPLCGGLCATGLATLTRWTGLQGWRLAVVAVLVLLATCIPAAWQFLGHPQVHAYAMPVGWIAGALYEDGVAVRWPYLAYRLLDLAIFLPVLALDSAVQQQRSDRSPRIIAAALRQLPAAGVGLAVAMTAIGVGWLRAGPERWRVDDATVLASLPVLVPLADAPDAPPYAVLHLPRGQRWQRPAALLAADVRFRFHQLTAWFGGRPGAVEVFAWPSAAAKQRGMGAYRVDMAKPWLRQVHVVLPDYGASVLTHELAHVFAGLWAPGPLHVPLRHGVVPDALTIEGMAVAAEWPLRGGLDPHQWARAARQLGKAPPLAELLSPGGFLRQNSELAYTIGGSLLRWIRDTQGPGQLQRLYRDGDLAAATGLTIAELQKRWGAFVDDPAAHPLTDADLQRAQARFEPAGLFDRTCALAVGRCRDRAAVEHAVGKLAAAAWRWAALRERLQQVGAQEDLGVELAFRDAQATAGQAAEATAALVAWLGDPRRAGQLSRLQRAEIASATGDLLWRSGDAGAARAAWQQAVQAPVGEGMRRLVEVKTALSAIARVAEPAGAQLALGFAPQRPERALRAVVDLAPDQPVAQYLWLRHALRTQPDESNVDKLLQLAPQLEAGQPWTAREARRLGALHLARLGRCAELGAVDLGGEPTAWVAELSQRCADARLSGVR